MYNVIEYSMPMVTPLTPDTAEAMRAQVIHLSPTVEISMRMTEGGAKAEDNTTLIVLSSILKPREEMGRAFNQAPDSLVEAAMRRARDCASGALILQHRIGHRRHPRPSGNGKPEPPVEDCP